jgi:hypothetical protein
MTQELIEKMTAITIAESDPEAMKRGFKNVPQGAATQVWAAVTAPADLVGGRYCEDCAVAKPAKKGRGVRPYSMDPERAKTLWTKTEKMLGMA